MTVSQNHESTASTDTVSLPSDSYEDTKCFNKSSSSVIVLNSKNVVFNIPIKVCFCKYVGSEQKNVLSVKPKWKSSAEPNTICELVSQTWVSLSIIYQSNLQISCLIFKMFDDFIKYSSQFPGLPSDVLRLQPKYTDTALTIITGIFSQKKV